MRSLAGAFPVACSALFAALFPAAFPAPVPPCWAMSAQNAELKGLIEKVRPAIAAHLEHAKHIQASLGKG